MKKTLTLITAALFTFAAASFIYADENPGQTFTDQDTEFNQNNYDTSDSDEMDDFDSLFDDAEDQEDAEEKAPVVSTENSSQNNSGIKFTGSFSMSAGGIIPVFRDKSLTDANPAVNRKSPYASMESYLGFSATPFDGLTFRAKIKAAFPDFSIGLSSIYVDYVMFDKVYLSAGRTGTTWGNSFIFDTNILDDSAKDSASSSDGSKSDTYYFINGNDNNASSHFFVIASVPFGKGEFQGLAKYESTSATLNKDYISCAASLEYALFDINFQLFARNWCKASLASGSYGKAPAFGASATGELFDFHFNLWGAFNMPLEEKTRITYARFVGGVSRYWTADPKMALTLEYEFVYDYQNNTLDPVTANKLGFKWAWSHVSGSIFSPSLQCFGNLNKAFGVVIPGVTLSGIPGLRNAQITFTSPVFWGNQTYTYKGAVIQSTAEKPTVVFGAVITLSAGF